ncbi:MAG: hypothetical protein WC471_04545 [Candidatus Woesearchaeota archaeon]
MSFTKTLKYAVLAPIAAGILGLTGTPAYSCNDPKHKDISLEAVTDANYNAQNSAAIKQKYYAFDPRAPERAYAQKSEERAAFYGMSRRSGVDQKAFTELEDVVYRMAHNDERALRNTYAHLHPLAIQAFNFNKYMHTGPQSRDTSRHLVADKINVFTADEQMALAGVLSQAGYKVHSTEELMAAVSDLYAIFSKNIREDKDYHAMSFVRRGAELGLAIYGIKHFGKGGKNDPKPYNNNIKGGNITGGNRVGPRGGK